MNDVAAKLAHMKAQRDALNVAINAVEAGLSKAAYDGAMASQLLTINEARVAEGKPPLTMTEWMMGQEGDSA